MLSSIVPAPQPLNAVTDLRVLLPETLEGGECQAGTSTEVHVAVLTENGMSLPPGVAAGALTLKVTPPGAGWVGAGLGSWAGCRAVKSSGIPFSCVQPLHSPLF